MIFNVLIFGHPPFLRRRRFAPGCIGDQRQNMISHAAAVQTSDLGADGEVCCDMGYMYNPNIISIDKYDIMVINGDYQWPTILY